MVTEVILPVLGETMNEGTIVEWVKQEGNPVRRGEVLFTLESDKATLEVEATTDGFLRRILVPAGQTVPVLTVVGLITSTMDEPVAESASQRVSESARPPSTPSPPISPAPPTPSTPARIFASPRARKLAAERGVDLAAVKGSGVGGRIVEKDVVAYLEAAPKATPVARRVAEQAGVDLRAVSGTGPGGRITKADVVGATLVVAPEVVAPEVVAPQVVVPQVVTPPAAAPQAEIPLTGVRSIIARRMFEGHSITAPVTLTMETDATEFVTLRERLKASLADELGFNIGYNDLLIKLVAHALRRFPYMNARLEGETIRQLSEVHIGLAVDTERGLLVPVVRDADRKRLTEVAREVQTLIERARAGKATPDDLTGSTFTITNLGMYDVDGFTPIINLPEAAVLGIGRIKPRPAVMGGAVCVRQMVWLSLTFDHRLVDGAPAARFLQYIKNLIEDPYLWLADCM